MNTCIIDDCDREQHCRKYCPLHYRRLLRTGDPLKATLGEPHAAQYSDDGLKVCKGCGAHKPTAEYHKDAGSPDGLRARCKPCRSGHMAGYYQDNKAEKVAYERSRRLTNGDAIRAYDKARYQRDKDKRMVLAYKHVHIRRARLAGVATDAGLTVAKLRTMHGDECCYCGVTMTFKRGRRGEGIQANRASLEHLLPLSRGGTHTFDNTTLACHYCNTRKGNKTVDEFAKYMNELTNAG